MENEYLKKAIESVYNQIVIDSMRNKEVIIGEDILIYTKIDQVNLFIMKDIFERWEESFEKQKVSYFDYNNEELVKELKKYMIVLSKNILLQNQEIKKLTISAIKDFLSVSIQPFQYYKNEFQKFYNKVSIKKLKEREKYYIINQEIYSKILDKLSKSNDENHTINQITNKIDDNKIELKNYESNLHYLTQNLGIDTKNLFDKKQFNESDNNKNKALKLFHNNKTEMNEALQEAKSKMDFKSAAEYLLNNYGNKYSWNVNDNQLNDFLKSIYKFYK